MVSTAGTPPATATTESAVGAHMRIIQTGTCQGPHSMSIGELDQDAEGHGAHGGLHQHPRSIGQTNPLCGDPTRSGAVKQGKSGGSVGTTSRGKGKGSREGKLGQEKRKDTGG